MRFDSSASISDSVKDLTELPAGARGRVAAVVGNGNGRADRLAAYGVTPGASIVLLQRFPCFVFLCDETQMAVEPEVARSILVELR